MPSVNLNVPYAQKDEAKALGAKWNPREKKWYAPSEEVIFKNRGLWKWVPASAKRDLKAKQDALDLELAEEKARQAPIEAWKARPPRFNTAQELLDLLGIDRSSVQKRDGFCGMCDSTMRQTWSLSSSYDFYHHIRYDPITPDIYYNQKEYDIIIAELEAELKLPSEILYPKLSISSASASPHAHRKLTVTQICQLERCEQQMIYDRDRGEQRSAAWIKKGEAGTKAHRRYELQVASGQKPKGSPCFIATACFGPDSYEVLKLRQYRDLRLRKTALGRWCIGRYYKISPPIARLLQKMPLARRIMRFGLKVTLWALKHLGRVS